ncbi:hypothetical protein APR04_001724 [Promicromonospora umidemergens]|uniref:Integral membrane protein n=1 Tax=Promicromonospora umidemergens TaxID=629679 RepID=A0ABP8XIH4_9MICO|nr:DUF6112 family protein [Promicromonospora umidemergens]MCP2282821.1 hypothetical protein [Promicromonospora umidemergens]
MTPSTAFATGTGLATGVGPDFGAVTGSGLYPIIGALLTITLVTAVAMLVVCAAIWAVASAVGSWQVTSKSRTGVLLAAAGSVLSGGALTWINWLIDLGNTL